VRFLLSFITCLLVVNPAFSQGGADDGSSVTSRIYPVHTKAEALERASLFTGFREIREKMATKSLSENDVQLINLIDTTTPFLNKFTNCQKVWQVSYENVIFTRYYKKDTPSNHYLNFEVFIDSATGNFVKAVCRLKELDPYEDPELSAIFAEEQIGQNDNETYAIPDSPPQVDLATALSACVINPFTAKEIVAQYVLLKERNSSFKPTWIISLRGVQSLNVLSCIPPPSTQKDTSKPVYVPPVYTKNRIRQAINAITGKMHFSSTIPFVPLTPEDRYILRHGKPKEQKKE